MNPRSVISLPIQCKLTRNSSALKRLATFSNDGGYVINPARFDPAKVTLSTFGQSANKVLSWKPQSGQPARAICMTMGFVFTCNVVFPTSFGKQQSQTVKSVLFGPVRAEWERTMAFFGTVFNRSELPISTFTASQRYVGVNMRTFPSDPTPARESFVLLTNYWLILWKSQMCRSSGQHPARALASRVRGQAQARCPLCHRAAS